MKTEPIDTPRDSASPQKESAASGLRWLLILLYGLSFLMLGGWGFLFLTRTPGTTEIPSAVPPPEDITLEKKTESENSADWVRQKTASLEQWDRERTQMEALPGENGIRKKGTPDADELPRSAYDWKPETLHLDGEWTKVDFPSTVTECRIGNDGRILVLRAEALPGLICLDLKTQSILKTIRLETKDFLYAAGKNGILVYHADTHVYRRFSYEAVGVMQQFRFSGPGTMLALRQGMSSDKALVIMQMPDHTNRVRSTRVSMIDSKTGAELARKDLEKAYGNYNNFGWSLAADPALNQLFIYNSVLLIHPDQPEIHASSIHPSGIPGPGGLYYDQMGNIRDTSTRKLYEDRYAGHIHTPDLRLPLFASIQTRESQNSITPKPVMLNVHGGHPPLATLGNIPFTKENGHRPLSRWHVSNARIKPVYHERMALNVSLGRFFLLPPPGNHALIRSFDPDQLRPVLEEQAAIQSFPPLTVKLRQTWGYQIQRFGKDAASAGRDSYTLLQAPQGLAISEKGQMAWTPTDAKGVNRPHPVLVRITTPDGKEQFQSFTVQVTP